MTSPTIATLVQDFFADHLPYDKHASPQTICAYRDAFRLLLQFLLDTTGRQPTMLCLDDIDAETVLAFLDHLERKRDNSVRSRNARLSAVRSFFRFVALREAGSLDLVAPVLAIPNKRSDRPPIGYLTRHEIDAILATPNSDHWTGRRDRALLAMLYNTGARVSELSSLQRSQVVFGREPLVHLHGKGRKERSVPLWRSTSRVLEAWLHELDGTTDFVFPNARGGPLTRHGLCYILQRVVRETQTTCPTLANKRVSPRVIRHTTAMHLLQDGVEPATIARWLGNETSDTTHLSVESDLAMKRRPPGRTRRMTGALTDSRSVTSG